MLDLGQQIFDPRFCRTYFFRETGETLLAGLPVRAFVRARIAGLVSKEVDELEAC